MGEVTGKPNVLLVDDDESIAELYKRALKKAGYAVRHAENGNEALEKIEQQLPAIVVCDVMMPFMDGFSFLQKLRTDARFALTPVLLMTALNGEQDRASGFRYGADGYLVKPVKPNALIEEVGSVLKRNTVPAVAGSGEPFTGDLSTLGVAALLIALSAERRTGRLKLDADGLKGALILREGVPISAAAAGAADALGAVAQMMDWRSGKFEFAPRDVSDVEDVLMRPLAQLLSDAEAARE